VALVDQVIRAQQAATVLELGAGSGRISWRLATAHPDASFVAVEPYQPLSEYGAGSYALENLIRAPSIPSASTTDVAFSIDVIHHLKDRPAVFTQLRDALVPRGVWVAIEPNIWHPAILYSQEKMRRSGMDEDHYRPWRSEPELVDAGFQIEARRYMHLWPPALKHPPRLATIAERVAERLRPFGASVVYRLRAS
jgi:trans-aconitate methyltransferase